MNTYARGSIVAIPLPSADAWIISVVAHQQRSRTRMKWIILYSFYPPFRTMPTVEESHRAMVAENILLVMRTSDVEILNKRWPVIGSVSDEVLERYPLLPVAVFWGSGADELHHGPYSLRVLHPESLDDSTDLGPLSPADASMLPEAMRYGWVSIPQVLELAVAKEWKGRRPIPGYPSRVNILAPYRKPV